MQKLYFYGANVQGIQSFIFETNKLKEMVGASALVDDICKDFFFNEFLKGKASILDKDCIRFAAGNIRVILRDQELAQFIVRYFPKKVQEYAPGIVVSQALEEFQGDLTQEIMDKLERALKTQRNRSDRPFQMGLGAIAYAPRTGKPAYRRSDGERIDIGSFLKQKKFKEDATDRLAKSLLGSHVIKICDDNISFPFYMDEIALPEMGNWIAVIHADGNGLGKLIQALGKILPAAKVADGYRLFSEALNRVTLAAAQAAFQKVIRELLEQDQPKLVHKKFPFRPLILGGDDLTVICRADLAIPFTVEFLTQFEQKTEYELDILNKTLQTSLGGNLTACAGIAFIKSSYPFYYGYHLAEELCSKAKKASRKHSSLAFHKVLSSFQDEYEEMEKRELIAKPSDGDEVHFAFGPYAIRKDTPNMPYVQDLLDCVEALRQSDSPRSGLRQWLSMLSETKAKADQWIDRVAQIASEKQEFSLVKFNEALAKLGKGLSLRDPICDGKTPIYDLLMLIPLKGRK